MAEINFSDIRERHNIVLYQFECLMKINIYQHFCEQCMCKKNAMKQWWLHDRASLYCHRIISNTSAYYRVSVLSPNAPTLHRHRTIVPSALHYQRSVHQNLDGAKVNYVALSEFHSNLCSVLTIYGIKCQSSVYN